MKALHKGDRWFQGEIIYPPVNHGLALLHTNQNNVAIFNNGTYHINITLPTKLDEYGRIENWSEFVDKHRQMARLFQWITPLLIAKLGSGDCFRHISKSSGELHFPQGSQRCCVSRYIGVATYDTVAMKPGKILIIDNPKMPWMREIYEKPECAYKMLESVGLDINFHKHHNHGLEFRIFDWFPESMLPFVMSLFVYMADEALTHVPLNEEKEETKVEVSDPRFDKTYNHLLARAIWDGNVEVTNEEVQLLCKVFDVTFEPNATYDCDLLLRHIFQSLREKWTGKGLCTTLMKPTE